MRPVLWGLSWKKNPQTFQVEVEIKWLISSTREWQHRSASNPRNYYLWCSKPALECLNQGMGNIMFVEVFGSAFENYIVL